MKSERDINNQVCPSFVPQKEQVYIMVAYRRSQCLPEGGKNLSS